MKVAKLINGEFFIQSIYEMYPNVSFPREGVPDVFLEENNLYKVIDFLNHDQETERYFLLPAPMLKENIVYTAEVVSKTEEEIKQDKLIKIREVRNKLLNESDIEVTIDKWENYTQEKKDSWKEYRQLLRDFPQSVENLSLQDLNIKEWPAKPGVNKINSICQALQ